jgi:hypothetical protein
VLNAKNVVIKNKSSPLWWSTRILTNNSTNGGKGADNDNPPCETVIPRTQSYYKMLAVLEWNPLDGELSAEEPTGLIKRAIRGIPLMNMQFTE